jgi:NADH-quinone oxidoreductase subunit J
VNLPDLPGAPVEILLFAGLVFLALVSSLAVICARDPFVSALALLGNFASLGILYVLLEEPFVAVSQILVYAGAVVVLFLFVIAYLGDRREIPEEQHRARWLRPVSIGLGSLIGLALMIFVLSAHYPKTADVPDTFGGAAAVGESFLTKFLLEFEMTSIVLLVAAIGGIVLGLTGRARHSRLRKLMNTRSADQQRRAYDRRARGEGGDDILEPAPSLREPVQ